MTQIISKSESMCVVNQCMCAAKQMYSRESSDDVFNQSSSKANIHVVTGSRFPIIL